MSREGKGAGPRPLLDSLSRPFARFLNSFVWIETLSRSPVINPHSSNVFSSSVRVRGAGGGASSSARSIGTSPSVPLLTLAFTVAMNSRPVNAPMSLPRYNPFSEASTYTCLKEKWADADR